MPSCNFWALAIVVPHITIWKISGLPHRWVTVPLTPVGSRHYAAFAPWLKPCNGKVTQNLCASIFFAKKRKKGSLWQFRQERQITANTPAFSTNTPATHCFFFTFRNIIIPCGVVKTYCQPCSISSPASFSSFAVAWW